jgi:hypothetical protein
LLVDSHNLTFLEINVFFLILIDDEEKDEHLCTFYDEEECRFSFVYTEEKDNGLKVRAQEDRECPPKVFMFGIVMGVIAAIVLIGMAMLLIWKAVTTISDRREFARFEKERMMAKWDTVSVFIPLSLDLIINNFFNLFKFRVKIQFTSKQLQLSKIQHMQENKFPILQETRDLG